jgi:predicted DNA-binding transcriptional regulator AlpA
MADVLPLRVPPTPTADPPADAAGPQPLLVDARRAAQLLGVGLRTLRAMDAAGRLPAPVRLSPGCVRWRLAELRDWTEAGCPDRATWACIRDVRK